MNEFVECEHLLQLELRVRDGAMPRPTDRSPQADLISAKGEAHERAYRDELSRQGLTIAAIDVSSSFEAAAAATHAAMASGIDVVYQATFVDSDWRGRADFLKRVDRPSALGSMRDPCPQVACHTLATMLLSSNNCTSFRVA